MKDSQVRLNGRVSRLEARLTATAPEDDAEVKLWASLWAEARVWQEAGDPENVQVLEKDRVAARGFFAYCRSAGEKPTFAALSKMERQQ